VEDHRVYGVRSRQRRVGPVHRLERRQHDVALLGLGELVLAVAAVGGRSAKLVGDEPRT
jgi:hypothetical protein